MYCNECGKTNCEILKTVFGYSLCEDCWDEYINTDIGKLEYLKNIVCGEMRPEELDADFLGTVLISWQMNKNLLPESTIKCWEYTMKRLRLIK